MQILEALTLMRDAFVKDKASGFTTIEVKFDDIIPLLDAAIERIEGLEEQVSNTTGVAVDLSNLIQ